MNKEKLLELADHMEWVKPESYNQGSWLRGENLTLDDVIQVDRLNPSNIYSPDMRFALKEGFCNTSACVLGHATSIKGHNLFLSFNLSGTEKLLRNHEVNPLLVDVCVVNEFGNALVGTDAAQHVYDIPEDHARAIFGDPGSSWTKRFYGAYEVSPKTVAARLREYVDSDGATIEAIISDVDYEE